MHGKKLMIFVIFALTGFAANGATTPKLNEPLLRASFANLKDPDSAKFKNIVYGEPSDGVWSMCGEVNAKNSYGGYIGFSRFFGSVVAAPKKPPIYFIFATGEAADMTCKQKGL